MVNIVFPQFIVWNNLSYYEASKFHTFYLQEVDLMLMNMSGGRTSLHILIVLKWALFHAPLILRILVSYTWLNPAGGSSIFPQISSTILSGKNIYYKLNCVTSLNNFYDVHLAGQSFFKYDKMLFWLKNAGYCI
jgi:hypothetical protein